MWFYIPAAIFIALCAWRFSRSSVYRHLRSGHGIDPGQNGSSRGTPL
jgi:hypothetical protein